MALMGSWKRTTDAAAEPVTTAEAKTQVVVDHSNDDTYIDTLVKSARMWCEHYTRRAFIDQTWVLSLDQFPSGSSVGEPNSDILLPVNPISSITTFAYTDTAGAGQTLAVTTGYQLDDQAEPGRLTVPVAGSWPATQAGKVNAVQITYVAGYGSSASDVPEPIKHAIKLLTGHWYENREAVMDGSMGDEVAFAVHALLDPFRMIEVH